MRGSDTAPVTVVEYGSLTCDHCIRFHRQILPILEERYIRTGRVRFAFRDFPTSDEAVRGAVAARCVPSEAYHSTLDALFATVARWSHARDVDAALEAEIQQLRLATPRFAACFRDPKKTEANVREQRRDAARRLGVTGTPTFLINDRVVRGATDLAAFDRLIVAAEAHAARSAPAAVR
jgi:protein-disulfide isomerase